MSEVFMPDRKRSQPARIGNHGACQGFSANRLNPPTACLRRLVFYGVSGNSFFQVFQVLCPA
jgi:hypothetical protein